MADFEKLRDELAELLLGNDTETPVAWTKNLLQNGISALDFFNEVFTPAMSIIGDKFGSNS